MPIKHTAVSYYGLNYEEHARADFLEMKEHGCDTVFFGHMHICQDFIEDGVRMLNPGSIAYSRDYSGKSYMLVTVTPEKIDAVRMNYIPVKTDDEKPKKKSFLERLIEKL